MGNVSFCHNVFQSCLLQVVKHAIKISQTYLLRVKKIDVPQLFLLLDGTKANLLQCLQTCVYWHSEVHLNMIFTQSETCYFIWLPRISGIYFTYLTFAYVCICNSV